MRKLFYLFVVIVFGITSVACSSDDHDNFGVTLEEDIDARAEALGFEDAASYIASVEEQCAEGNHENCDINNDGSHHVCAYADHSGKKHDGSHHEGIDHGSHHKDKHSHGSHDEKHH